MAFKIKNSYIPVSAEFINNYMPAAHGEYVKVYLYALAAAAEGRSADNKQLAALLNLLLTDVENAWAYWAEKGLVELDGADVSFLPCPDAPPAPPQADETRPPHITAREVSRALEMNPAMKDTISMVEQFLGKPLSSREITSIFNFMDWYGMDGDMVLMLFEYCISMGKKNFSYIEKVAQSWNSEGITDIKSAEALIRRATDEKKFQGRCKTIFGLDRNFSAAEQRYINSWCTEMGFSPEMVAEAYEITVKNTGKLAFAYMNKILASWHQKGIKSPKDIAAKDAKAPAVGGHKIDEQALIEMRRRLQNDKSEF